MIQLSSMKRKCRAISEEYTGRNRATNVLHDHPKQFLSWRANLIGWRLHWVKGMFQHVTASKGVGCHHWQNERDFCRDKPAQQLKWGTLIGGIYKINVVHMDVQIQWFRIWHICYHVSYDNYKRQFLQESLVTNQANLRLWVTVCPCMGISHSE